MGYKFKVTKPYVHVDRTLQTASWWDEFVILPGEYDVEFTSIGGHPCTDPVGAYYADVKVDAVLTREYRVNRLMQHTSSHTEVVNKVTTFPIRWYAYEITGRYGEDMPTKSGPKVETWGGTIIQEQEVPA